MHACGVVVEYNPFHHGHLYHLQKTKELTKADCIVAVMSGSFLQRGEPAIIDKFHRTKAALAGGADIVIELPYAYAVQSSELFAKGAILSLHALGVSSICFGSESGQIEPFLKTIAYLNEQQQFFDEKIKTYLKQGYSYPKASNEAFQEIGLTEIDMMKPNNILGYSYVKTISQYQLPIKPFTIKRIQNDYHDQTIHSNIASATSIRNELFTHHFTENTRKTIPTFSIEELVQYENKANMWHHWSHYFPYLTYQILSQSVEQLSHIHGIDEGLEYRIKKEIHEATSFDDLIDRVKSKRYTQVRLQRVFTHILTNTKKKDVSPFTNTDTVPYVRLLGMNETGQQFLNEQKKLIDVPLITNLNKKIASLTQLDEKGTQIYYSILPPAKRKLLLKQEFSLPIRSMN